MPNTVSIGIMMNIATAQTDVMKGFNKLTSFITELFTLRRINSYSNYLVLVERLGTRLILVAAMGCCEWAYDCSLRFRYFIASLSWPFFLLGNRL